MEPSLSERARALVLEAEVEREALERRRQEVMSERETEVAEVRERYRAILDKIDDDLALAMRLRKALDPEGAKRTAAAKTAAKTAERRRKTAPAWRPRPEVFAVVYESISSGHETVREIAEAPEVNVSEATVKIVLDYARDEGSVRLAGKKGQARCYRLTPQGAEVAQNTMNGSHVGTNA